MHGAGVSQLTLADRGRLTQGRPGRLDGDRWRRARQRRGRELLRHPRVRTARPPPLADRQTLRTAVFDFIEVFYNRKRRHSTLDYTSPANYEQPHASAAPAA